MRTRCHPQSSSARPSVGIPKCGFVVVRPVWRRVLSVFRYHQAAANPPAKAEAAAMTPILIHSEGRASADGAEEELLDSEWLVILLAHFHKVNYRAFHSANRRALGALRSEKERLEEQKKNFDFCICILPNLCYAVFIPLEERFTPSLSVGSSLRHWPPGTNS